MPEEDVQKNLQHLPTWSRKGGMLTKHFEFKDFKEAMEFVNKIATLAEENGHHPDLSIAYNKVDVMLMTHAVGGLSMNDFVLAAKIETL